MLTRKRSGKEVGSFVGTFWGIPLPVPGSPNDPREAGAVLDLFSATEEAVAHLPMPATSWKASGDGRVFRFLNPKAPNATSPVASATLNFRRRRIKIDSRAVGLALAGPQTAVGVRLTVGSSRYGVVYRRPNFRRDLVDQVVAAGYSTPPLDCADKRMRFALEH